MKTIVIDDKKEYSIDDVCLIAENKAKIVIGKNAQKKITDTFTAVQNAFDKEKIYGLTTGVGDLSQENPTLPIDTVQKNILLSHSVGVGENLPKITVRAIIFSRLLTLSQGMSGVSFELITLLAEILNKDVIPLVPALGSIGASDLTILAGSFVMLCNKGKVTYEDTILTPFEAFVKAGISYPKELQTREGLALINGNNGAIGVSALLLKQVEAYLQQSITTAALCLEGRSGTYSVYNSVNQQVKKFKGQDVIATQLKDLLKESQQISTEYANKNSTFLQDPPSFKTIAQVIGNALDILENAKRTITTELNSATDNPLLITTETEVIPVSSGNYLCAQLVTMLDTLTLVIAQVAESSVARIKILLNAEYNEGLPKYLIEDARNNSGFMIVPYTGQSLLSEIKALLYPRSSFSSSVANGWEDISTNAFNCARNIEKVLLLAKEISALELCLALQAMALRKKKNKTIQFGIKTSMLFSDYIITLQENGITLPIEKDVDVRELAQYLRKGLVWK
ncbi:MAG TPA: aromatic amino acid ammonia-lyase [Candidatus Saccharimonadales bacterium]|nr:aromatic amino acid ammonia-lyase [Candidatus Saccharimonadales bacterium]